MTSWIKSKRGIGEFIPKNTKKYVGSYPIIIRSGWERRFCTWVDVNQNIIEWSAEDIVIPYLDPIILNKKRRYYPDFWIKTKNNQRFIIEVKPLKDTRPPRASKKKSRKTILTEQKTYKMNLAKFKAAKQYADKMGMTFKIITEKELFGK
jgi:hypothetical protein